MQRRGWGHTRNRLHVAQTKKKPTSRHEFQTAQGWSFLRWCPEKCSPFLHLCKHGNWWLLTHWALLVLPGYLWAMKVWCHIAAHVTVLLFFMQKEAAGPSETRKHLEAPRYVCILFLKSNEQKWKFGPVKLDDKLLFYTVSKTQLNISWNCFV